MIKLKKLVFEQRYKYKWIELLDYNIPKNAVTGYRLIMKERGQEAMIDESDLKYFLEDQRFASKYKNNKYLFWVEEKRGGRRRRVYIVYVYSMTNLPADIQIHIQTDSTPHHNLNGAPVYFKLKVEREGGVLKGADSEEEKKAAAKAAAEREQAVGKEVEVADKEAEKSSKETEKPADKTKMSTYTVKSGDTLSKIAKQYGMTLNNILELNPKIQDANKIYPGQSINVSGKSAASAKTSSSKKLVTTTAINIPDYIKPIAKDLYDAVNYVFGTDEKLFDTAFDKIKTKTDAHYVNLEIARLEKDPNQDLESYIRGDFSGDEMNTRLAKLGNILGRYANKSIKKTNGDQMKRAAEAGIQATKSERDRAKQFEKPIGAPKFGGLD